MNRLLVRLLNGREITRQTILRVKRKALQEKVWTTALNTLERGMLDVTVQSVDHVKSRKLAQVLLRILTKLTDALNHQLLHALKKGRELATRISEIASTWGNLEAIEWRNDPAFRKALGLGVLFSNQNRPSPG